MIFAVAVATLAATLGGGAATPSAERLPSSPRVADSVNDTFSGKHEAHLLVGRLTPTFARQTRLNCAVCHLGGFPQLSRFGRLFKLNGYTLSHLAAIPQQADSTNRPSLALATIPGLSTMALVSATSMAKALPGTPGTRAEFPQQLSLLFGGEIAPHLGALAELSYTDLTGRVSIDNTDVRFANHTRLLDRDLLYGVTLHNNPTVQDVWNTAPAWSYPFTSPAHSRRILPPPRCLVAGSRNPCSVSAHTAGSTTCCTPRSRPTRPRRKDHAGSSIRRRARSATWRPTGAWHCRTATGRCT